MRTVIAQLSVAPVPKPVPIVVDDVLSIRSPRSGTLPHLVVEVIRRHTIGLGADGPADTAKESPSEINFANHTRMQLLHRLAISCAAATLIAHLHTALVLVGRLDHPLSFLRIVRRRFFHIDVLARFAP